MATTGSTSLILPTDNAVIDYSIISQMIAVINQQQAQINTLVNNATTPDATTGVPAVAKTVGGSEVLTGGATKVITTGLTKTQSAVAVFYSSGAPSTTPYVYLNHKDDTTIQFKSNLKSGTIYWMAYGTV